MRWFQLLLISGVILSTALSSACGGKGEELEGVRAELADAQLQLKVDTRIIQENNKRFEVLERANKDLLAQNKTLTGELQEERELAKRHKQSVVIEDNKEELAELKSKLESKNQRITSLVGERDMLKAELSKLKKTPAAEQTELVQAQWDYIQVLRDRVSALRHRYNNLGGRVGKAYRCFRSKGMIDRCQQRFKKAFDWANSKGTKNQDLEDVARQHGVNVDLLRNAKSATPVAIREIVVEPELGKLRGKNYDLRVALNKTKKQRDAVVAEHCPPSPQKIAKSNPSSDDNSKIAELKAEAKKARELAETRRKEAESYRQAAEATQKNLEIKDSLVKKLEQKVQELEEQNKNLRQAPAKQRDARLQLIEIPLQDDLRYHPMIKLATWYGATVDTDSKTIGKRIYTGHKTGDLGYQNSRALLGSHYQCFSQLASTRKMCTAVHITSTAMSCSVRVTQSMSDSHATGIQDRVLLRAPLRVVIKRPGNLGHRS